MIWMIKKDEYETSGLEKLMLMNIWWGKFGSNDFSDLKDVN